MNEFGDAIQKWWDSDAYKELMKSHQEGLEKAVGKYHMLSESEKLDMVQAICYIMCKAEQEGCSHRGLMDALGIYPSGFWISELMDVHNSLYTFFDDKRQKQELEQDIKSFKQSNEKTQNSLEK